MKSKTLKENKDFRRLYYKSKKIGCAVERNRAKRVIRAAFSQLEGRINGSYDFVFVARTKTSKVKMQKVLEQMEQHFKALGVID